MSKNKLSKEARRARRLAREEEQGKNVIKWITGVMLALFLVLVGYFVIFF